MNRKNLLFGFGIAMLLAGGGYAFYNHTFVTEVDYKPCEITYGELIGSWEGSATAEPWNEQGYRYEARRFKLEATSAGLPFPNVAEQTPTLIRTSSADGSHPGCRDGFDGRIDPAQSSFRWNGSRPVDLRLGVPDLGEVNNGGRFGRAPRLRVSESLRPPVYGDEGERAAAHIDDGGRAVIQTEDRGETHELWCFGLPLGDSQNCPDITSTGERLRGSGYLFTSDNCPAVFRQADVSCAKAADWYRQTELGKLVGTNVRGEIKPFFLHQEAISTFAPNVGAWTVMTFKYPAVTTLKTELKPSSSNLNPTEPIQVELIVSKTGPDITGLALKNQPDQRYLLGQTFERELAGDELAVLNGDGELRLSLTAAVQESAPRGTCSVFSVELAAQGPSGITAAPARFDYCVREARLTYFYRIRSLGAVKSSFDEFKLQVAETLISRLGWPAIDIAFKEVPDGQNFTVYLASPDQVAAASPGCDAVYSCNVGNSVYINDERWRGTTPSWQSSGGSLRDYRHMVTNHEVGHWLGFGHLHCPGNGQPAPVMQQQSIDLEGCTHNPWPTLQELNLLRARLGL